MEAINSIMLLEQSIEILDQTKLPLIEESISITDYRRMITAIKRLEVRGAPAIGIAAMGAAWLAAMEFQTSPDFSHLMELALLEIESARPTAVNLHKAIQHLRLIIDWSASPEEIVLQLDRERRQLADYEENACIQMGKLGADLIGAKANSLKILTHCNTGSLATVGIGTALGVIRTLADRIPIQVFADETRPLLQGARLTMWELQKSKIPAKLITDNMAAWIMKREKIDCIITGADRICQNGDSANKIGTYNLAILAKYHGIPFYIVAPETTIDHTLVSGEQIRIEERDASEVHTFAGVLSAPKDSDTCNPAFDVTPGALITAIITDKKVYIPPYSLS